MAQTILVIDDESRIVKLVCDYLERAGFAVLTAADGQAGLGQFDGVFPGGSRDDIVALAGQRDPDQLQDVFLIIDD